MSNTTTCCYGGIMVTAEVRLGPEAMQIASTSAPEIEYFRQIPRYAYGVIVVAIFGRVNDWAAYLAESEKGAEYCEQYGDKLSKETAETLFPWIAKGREYRT